MTQLVRTPEEMDALLEHLLDPARNRPVVALTSRQGDQDPAFDPGEVRAELGEDPELFVIPTGSRTFQMAERLGKERGVFGGAARIWWPGFTSQDRPLDHPLIFDRYGVYGTEALSKLSEAYARGPVEAEEAAQDELLLRKAEGLESANHRLLSQFAEARREIEELQARVRAADERARAAEKALRSELAGGSSRPSESGPRGEEALYHAIVDAWLGDHVGPSERVAAPLRPFVLGPAFAESVEQLAVEQSRVARVCAWVLDGRAEQMRSLAVHKLRSGGGGEDPQRSREDGALAWRVNLKVNTPGAPRLHYWMRTDGVVEFASVNHHDDLAVPE